MAVTRQFLIAAPIAFLLSACSQGQTPTITLPTSPTPTASPTPVPGTPTFATGPYTLSGIVRDSRHQPLAGVQVNAWLDQGPHFSYWYSWPHGQVYTDSQGYYELPGLPAGMVVHLTSWASGYVQQCSAPVITITDTTALDATLVSAESVSSAESSVPPSLPGYHTIRGTVYQTADGIRQPLAGAGVYYEPVWDIQVANTVTDGSGRFLLCGILSSASANLSAYAEHKGGWATVPPGQTEVEIDVR